MIEETTDSSEDINASIYTGTAENWSQVDSLRMGLGIRNAVIA